MKRLHRIMGALACLLMMATTSATQPAKQSIPSQAAQSDALQLIQKLFREDYQRTASQDESNFARLLIQESKNTHDNPAGCYVLLMESCRLATSAGDAETLAEAVRMLAIQYEVQQSALLTEWLPKILEKPRTTLQLRALANQAVSAIDLVIIQENFSLVEPLARAAEKSATAIRQVDFAVRIMSRVVDARTLVEEWKAAQQASARLKTYPDSAEDHLTVGRFYALRLGRFDQGLPELAAGSDKALAKIALMDLASPTEPMAQKSLADAWWEYASQSQSSNHALNRAKFWYAKARDSLTGLTLRDIDNRLSSSPATQPVLTGVTAQTDIPMDILALVAKTSLNGIEGEWSTDKEMIIGTGKLARLQLPVIPPQEYDLEMTFSREGRGGVVLLLANGERNFNLMLDISGTARLEQVNKKTRTDNPTVVSLDLDNGKTYVVLAQIRHNAVYVLLDGKQLITWRTDYKDLSRPSQWRIPNPKSLGVGISSGTVRIKKMMLKSISGQTEVTALTN